MVLPCFVHFLVFLTTRLSRGQAAKWVGRRLKCRVRRPAYSKSNLLCKNRIMVSVTLTTCIDNFLQFPRSAAPRPVPDGGVAGSAPLVGRDVLVGGVPRGLGENRCRQVGPRTHVALYRLHERDGSRRTRQRRVFKLGTFARRNQWGIDRHRPDDAANAAVWLIGT